MEHYTIEELRKEIERKRGESLTDDGFVLLVAGFKGFAARRGLYSRRSLDNAVCQGWMSAQMAHFFMSYALE